MRKTPTGKLLDEICSGFEAGSRNQSMTQLVGKLVRTGARPLTVIAMCEFANRNSAQPLPDKEVTNVIKSIMTRAIMQNRGDSDDAQT